MSKIIHKVKDAIHPNDHTTNNDHQDSSNKDPGVLHSTKHRVHGQRDPGTGLNPGLEEDRRALSAGGDGPGLTPTNTRVNTRADDLGATDMQNTGHGGLVGSDLSGIGNTSAENNADAAEVGRGLGYPGSGSGNTDDYIEGSGLEQGRRETKSAGEDDSEDRAEGLVDERGRDESDEVAGSGLSGVESSIGGDDGRSEVGSGLDGAHVFGGSSSKSHREASER